MTKRGPQKPANRREAVLAAAREIFEKKGFHGATTAEIAARAQVAEGTIFRYFKTKKDLLLALIEQVDTGQIAAFLHGAAQTDSSAALRFFLQKHLETMRGNLNLFRTLLYESQFHPELREKFLHQVVLKTLQPVEGYLARRMEVGEYRNINPGMAGLALFGMLASFIGWKDLLQADTVHELDEVEAMEAIIGIFLYGITRPHTPS